MKMSPVLQVAICVIVAKCESDGGVGCLWWGQASARPLAFIGCDVVRKPRSEELQRDRGAQAGVPVPLKGVL